MINMQGGGGLANRGGEWLSTIVELGVWLEAMWRWSPAGEENNMWRGGEWPRVLNLYMYTTLEYVSQKKGMDTLISKHWSIHIDKIEE
jgi:hypothetical protein